jgi:hypothetical protein
MVCEAVCGWRCGWRRMTKWCYRSCYEPLSGGAESRGDRYWRSCSGALEQSIRDGPYTNLLLQRRIQARRSEIRRRQTRGSPLPVMTSGVCRSNRWTARRGAPPTLILREILLSCLESGQVDAGSEQCEEPDDWNFLVVVC